MKVIFKGKQSSDELVESLVNIINLFKERYGIESFSEINLSMTLLDNQADAVELVDNRTSEIFRVFEVHQSSDSFKPIPSEKRLKLVIDNTKRCLKPL